MLQALLWDIDGTVAETERDGHRVAFNRAFEEAELDWYWDEARYGELLAVTGGRERLLADMVERAGAPTSATEREALALRLHLRKNHWYAALVGEGRIAPRPGVLALMRDAAAAGLAQVIVTTTSRDNVRALMPRLLGPAWVSTFALVLCGEDTARKKPHPEVYLQALSALGLRPDQTLAIEDSAPGGLAARAAAVPLLLRPSVYFPPATLPASLSNWIFPVEQDFRLPELQRWHAAVC
jgi:HAD superfamily hydrolase (TIGR01509 family)